MTIAHPHPAGTSPGGHAVETVEFEYLMLAYVSLKVGVLHHGLPGLLEGFGPVCVLNRIGEELGMALFAVAFEVLAKQFLRFLDQHVIDFVVGVETHCLHVDAFQARLLAQIVLTQAGAPAISAKIL